MTNLFDHIEFDHEMVSHFSDPASGLKAIIAVHSTKLGPAIGGCRMMPYASEDDALNDVLRLSKGMTYKCAIGGIPFGGGKAVIIGDPLLDKSQSLLHAMGGFVDRLGGTYITSFDAGTSLDDVRAMGERTEHVGGIKTGAGNASQSTAYGVFVCLKKSVSLAQGRDDLKGLRVAIQGGGNVGRRLAKLLAAEGAKILISDINGDLSQEIAAEVNSISVHVDEILTSNVDILAPCALGAILNDQIVNQIKAKIICGGANNQLSHIEIADKLKENNIFYCPDYLANAGGIIDLHYQLNEQNNNELNAHLDNLADKLERVLTLSSEQNINMSHAADLVAEDIIHA